MITPNTQSAGPDGYDVRDGIIRSPGKFEGEPEYAPYLWDLVLQGFADEDDGSVAVFLVSDEDRKRFPGLKGISKVTLRETADGFVQTHAENRS